MDPGDKVKMVLSEEIILYLFRSAKFPNCWGSGVGEEAWGIGFTSTQVT